MTIRKFLDLSTAHLSLETIDAIDAGRVPLATYPHPEGYGWFIYAPEYDQLGESLPYVPADLVECIKRANAEGCAYLLFDRDADAIDALPVFDEEPDEHEAQKEAAAHA